jgi:hypothetical protein
MGENKECFVISPIGPEGSSTRERADKILDHVIRAVTEERGYNTIRADEIDKPGQITTQIIQKTVNSDIVIADLTNQNPNVFYELAIRHAAREPFIQIIAKDQDIPFDLSDQRTIKIDIEDLDSVEDAKSRMANQIDKIESSEADVSSPISTAMDLHFWEESGDPQQQELADVIEISTEIMSELDNMRSEIETMQTNGFEDADIKKLIDIYDRSDDMEAAINDIRYLTDSAELSHDDDRDQLERAIDYIESNVKYINTRADEILEKYH